MQKKPTEKFQGFQKRSDFSKKKLKIGLFGPFFGPKNGSGAKNWHFCANVFALFYVLHACRNGFFAVAKPLLCSWLFYTPSPPPIILTFQQNHFHSLILTLYNCIYKNSNAFANHTYRVNYRNLITEVSTKGQPQIVYLTTVSIC